ncbi:uncharacterized protein MELLADRAFT_95711 [Melampsora larici-populina 98AG31]|uniref:Uncharacterized protein n=1 Tax=Melampsora larici-populina (strain 98AG31 / pathotype 3-4-7) TaxID=747676 RepID=F4SAC5_MELLP|nr:uncharacterized protein MELLADRAFT_95711 [Melampsora larici-populina 98AG31]EGF98423.1 hypothetical protein MELLADRAFT_95711 [Melampsora larici-populina 98AG31]
MRFVSAAQATAAEHFVQCTSGPNEGQWTCKLCTGRTFKDKVKHSKLKTHIDRVRLELERVSAAQSATATPGLCPRTTVPNVSTSSSSMFPEEQNIQADMPDSHHHMDLSDDGLAESSDELASLYDPSAPNGFEDWSQDNRESSVDIDSFLESTSNDSESNPRPPVDVDAEPAGTDTWLPWYPLRKPEVGEFGKPPVFHAAALMMLGTGRNLMSTAEYNRIRAILKRVLKVDLPDLGPYYFAMTS